MHSLVIRLASQYFIERLQCSMVLGTMLGSRCKVGDMVFNLCASIQCGRCAQVINTDVERPRTAQEGQGRPMGVGLPPLLNLRTSRVDFAEGIWHEGYVGDV